MKWCAQCSTHIPDKYMECLYCGEEIDTTTVSRLVLQFLNRLATLWVCGLTFEQVGDRQYIEASLESLRESRGKVEQAIIQDFEHRYIQGEVFVPKEYHLLLKNGKRRQSPMWVYEKPIRPGCGVQQYLVIPDGDEPIKYHSIRHVSGYNPTTTGFKYGELLRDDFEQQLAAGVDFDTKSEEGEGNNESKPDGNGEGTPPNTETELSPDTERPSVPEPNGSNELPGVAEEQPEEINNEDFEFVQVATNSRGLSKIYFQGGVSPHCGDVYIVRLNNIMHKLPIISTEAKYSSTYQNGRVSWTVVRRVRYATHSGTMSGKGVGPSKKLAENTACEQVLNQMKENKIAFQMDDNSKETNQGLIQQGSEKHTNTILTHEAVPSTTGSYGILEITDYCSGERIYNFNDLMDHCIQMDPFKISTSLAIGETVKTYFLPESLFGAECAPNLIPFETFIYSSLDIELSFKVNAQRFHCGKIVASVKYASYQADAMQATVQSAMQRPHVIIDLGSSNTAVLQVPFLFHRGFVRNVRHDHSSIGIRPSKYATVMVQVLSPLRTGEGSTTDMQITPYFRISRAKFAAMSYRAVVQMDNVVGEVAGAVSGEFRDMLLRAEKMILQYGKMSNRDKPTVLESTIVVPRPRLHFSSGKGLSDAQPMRVNPCASTSALGGVAPTSMLDVARMWGMRSSFKWSNQQPNVDLWIASIDPSFRRYDKAYSGVPTPVEYVCGMYQFWSGALEFRFDFSSNAFHTGAVSITIEYGRPLVLQASACHKSSNYMKVFHLGDQRSVHVTVPYIYDTIMRRCNGLVYQPNAYILDEGGAVEEQIMQRALSMRAESKTVIRVSVVNELRPIQSTTQEIDVLVFMRAGPSFRVHSLKQMSFRLTQERTIGAPHMDSFPRDGYLITDDKVQKPGDVSSTSKDTPARRRRHLAGGSKALPPHVRNMWNELAADKMKSGVKFQMDRNQDDQDRTHDFSAGLAALHIQTSDEQTNIKDILRRPTLIIWRRYVHPPTGTKTTEISSGYFVPLMPPSRMMAQHRGAAQEFCELINTTPQAAIMNLFRFWRGSMRYTIVLHGNYTKPIFVVHVPHSGVRIIGNQIIGKHEPNRPIHACGLTTELIVPQINPTAVIEVPYDTENAWTLTWEEDPQRNYSWRDKGDTNSGHLCIYAHEQIEMSVYWSAGDDFEVANFYGIPACKHDDYSYSYSDNHARVQMEEDFYDAESTTPRSVFLEVFNDVRRMVTPKTLLRAAVGSLPVVGMPSLLAPVVGEVESTVKSIQGTAKQAQETLKGMEVSSNRLTQILDGLGPVVDVIKSFLGTLPNPYMMEMWSERICELVCDVSYHWSKQEWSSIIYTLFKFLVKSFIIQWQLVTKLCEQAVQWVQQLTGVSAQAPLSPTATIVGAIVGLVGLAFNVKISESSFTKYVKEYILLFTKATHVSYLNQVIRFVQTTFELVRDAVMYALGLQSPEAVALKLLGKNSEILKQFITEAQLVLNDANSNMVLHPQFRTKFWYIVTQAYQIQQALSHVPGNVVSPQLGRLCSQVIKVGNEKFIDLASSPVRYEPFVICIEGKHGIGKSYMTDALVGALLENMGYSKSSSGWTYTRAPGSKFWSGYRDQPVIVYDDWLNLNNAELMSQQISELYQLKSTATFIPEMAHLEEKRIKANPIIVILLTNGAFPTSMSNVAHHPDAVFRRRDVVLHAELREEFQASDLRNLSEEDSSSLNHLQFYRYADAQDRDSRTAQSVGWSTLKTWIQGTHLRYHRQEEVNVKKRIELLHRQLRVQSDTILDFADPFALLYTVTDTIAEEVTQNAWLPSEQLKCAVMEIVNKVRTLQVDQVPIVVPPPPDDVFIQFDCCPTTWQGFVSAIGTGLILTPEVWKVMFKWGAEGLREVLSGLQGLASSPIEGECAVCMEHVALQYQCVASEGQHRYCASCWHNVQRLSPQVHCPVCRGVEIAILMNQSDGLVASIIMWLAKMGMEVVIPVLNWLVRALGGVKTRVFHKINLIGELIMGWMVFYRGLNTPAVTTAITSIVAATALTEEDVWYDAIDYQEVVRHAIRYPSETAVQAVLIPSIGQRRHELHHFSQEYWEYQERLMALEGLTLDDLDLLSFQMDRPSTSTSYYDPWTKKMESSVVEDTPIQDTAFEIRFGEEAFQRSREVPVKTRLPKCYHKELLDNVITVVYLDSKMNGPCWKTVITTGSHDEWVLVPNARCEGGCHWDDEDNHRRFCEQYMKWQRGAIISAYRNYVSVVVGDPVEFLRKLPRFAWPYWYREDEVVTITETTWWEYLSDTWNQYKHIIYWSGAVVGACMVVSKLVGALSPAIPIQAGGLDYDPGHTRHLRGRNQQIRFVRESDRMVRTQGDEDFMDTVTSKVYNNYMIIQVQDKTGQILKNLVAIGVCDLYAILPMHYVRYLRKMKENVDIYLSPARVEWAGSQYRRQLYTWSDIDWLGVKETDLAIFRVPASYGMFKDIRKFMALEKDLQSYLQPEGDIFVASTRAGVIPTLVPIDILGFCQSVKVQDLDQEYEAYDLLQYNYSKAGACGSVVLLHHTQRPIAAMHCAGSGVGHMGKGYGVFITQEVIASLIAQFKTIVISQFEECKYGSLAEAHMLMDIHTNVEYLGTVEEAKQVHIPQKTKIRKSLIHDMTFQPVTEPTILSKTDPRYVWEMTPLYYGVCKHGKLTTNFPRDWVLRAGTALYEGWMQQLKPAVVKPKKLTYEEAVRGIEGVEFYDPMSLNTSAGYPWNLGEKKTKDGWIQLDPFELNDVLFEELERKYQLRKQGIVPQTLFVDTLKDERKDPQKVRKKGGTRVFCSSPMDYTIALRQSLLHFCAAYMKHRAQLMHAVGCDVHGSEWGEMWRRLYCHQDRKVFTLDYSNFGPGFNAEVARMAASIMIKWTKENVVGVDPIELECLLWECINSIHICGNLVYQQTCGSPSGAALTTIINSVVNTLYVMIAWDQLCHSRVMEETPDIWKEFQENVALIVYGDDLVCSVSGKYQECFNGQTITQFFSGYGLTTVGGQKDGAVHKFEKPTEIRFLKRLWVDHPNLEYEKLAPLPEHIITDITQWVWSSPSIKESTSVNCDSALLEAYEMGPAYFEVFKQKLNKDLIQAKITPKMITWSDIDYKFYKQNLKIGNKLAW